MALDGTSFGSGNEKANTIAATTGILASLASALALSISRGRQKKQGISIMGIDLQGAVVIGQQTFQWWPESLSDSIAIGWQAKQIPGASHDVMQWGGNSGRSIGFSIKLSRTLRPDADFNASGVGFTQVPATARGIRPSAARDLPHNVDIVKMVKYLRSYCYPLYEGEFNQPSPPVTCVLHVPGLSLNEDGSDHILAVMTACDVTYNRLFADGTPRLAEVGLAFKQIVQDHTGIHWKGRDVFTTGSTGAGNGLVGLAGLVAVASDPGDMPSPPTP